MKHFKIRLVWLVVILTLAPLGLASTPKNTILMISDGCGYPHIPAASLLEHGKTGVQIYEQFPVRYGMSTYSAQGIGYDPNLAWNDFPYVRQKPSMRRPLPRQWRQALRPIMVPSGRIPIKCD